ncbi:PucR family transcriptional regulator [Actinomadura rugatobispora]|uniref:PucR family transcriptional regulator n=1 Tax=Actinomadura rugatobispora TaxID=1994 RepID=A0ABW1AE93_9ACTN|nr:PucR family transcriptional regulator [Actinomadura rugatobispora]
MTTQSPPRPDRRAGRKARRRDELARSLVERARLPEAAPSIAVAAAHAARSQILAYEWGPPPSEPRAAREPYRPDLLTQAIQEALCGFPAALEQDDAVPAPVLDVFWLLGEAEARAGRDLADLQEALSIAGGVATQRLTEGALGHGFTTTPDEAGRLVRSGLTYINRLRHAAAAGYAAVLASGEPAAGADRARRRLLEALLRPGCRPDELEKAAADAGWTLPRTLAVVAVDSRRVPTRVPRFLPPDVLPALHLDGPCLIVPDPAGPGRRDVLRRILGDHPAVVGPTVEPGRAALSLRLARRGLDRLPAEVIAARTPVHVAEHIPTLLLLHSPDLTRYVIDRRLAPFERFRPSQRDRLAETLLAYIECGFNAVSTAERLRVHPQTVRSRIRHLNHHLGPDIYDPEHALDYLMALHAWRLRSVP